MQKPKIIITHGNRALNLAHRVNSKIPIVTVAHNNRIDKKLKSNFIIALTNSSYNDLQIRGFKQEQIFILPNMFDITEQFCKREFEKPIIIGTIARFVEKKGLDILIKALNELKKQKIIFKAVIGGEGPDEDRLHALVNKYNLSDEVSFVGWIEDKQNFFKIIDIFCLTSLIEPFGISLLEAIGSSTPIIASKTQGPLEIVRNKIDGLLFETGSYYDLSEAIKFMINNEVQVSIMALNAFKRLQEKYSFKIVANSLKNIIYKINSKDVSQ